MVLLREASAAFITATQTDRSLSKKESVQLRAKYDCLFSLLEEARVDPVELYLALPLPSAAEPAVPAEPALLPR